MYLARTVLPFHYKRTVDDAGHVKFDQIGETVWFDCRLWGVKAEKLTKTLQKGMPVVVLSRSISLRKTEKDGQEYKNLVVDADDVLVSLLANRVEEVKLRPAKEGDAPDTANTASESDMPF